MSLQDKFRILLKHKVLAVPRAGMEGDKDWGNQTTTLLITGISGWGQWDTVDRLNPDSTPPSPAGDNQGKIIRFEGLEIADTIVPSLGGIVNMYAPKVAVLNLSARAP